MSEIGAASTVQALPTDAVETWYLPVEDLLPHPWAQYEDLLCPEERIRAARFLRSRDRRHYTAAHALLRVMLSSFAQVPAKMWRFCLGPQGRPEIEPGLSTLPLRFSLSHTDRLVAAAVTLRRDIGLDVEALGRSIHDMESVVRFFAAEEIALLNGYAPERRQQAFIKVWTLKEAFVKATGLGLSLPLDQFAVTLDADRLLFAPAEWNPPEEWQFRVLQPTPMHQMAVVARAEAGTSLQFVALRVAARTLTPEPDPHFP
jgi:4'-phosphopantetheinyl transferase